ncbi:MAG: carboxypeptidase regulatory-like domain-containing protein [Bryobacterales bacterium]|nr:carboxypeptidase regulatory-like domain-containing protein [Bryobacterales bacterium]
MGHTHLTRRQILASIPVLTGAGAMLAPLRGQKPGTSAPAIIRGKLRDQNGHPIPAKIRVTESNTGQVYMPEKAIKTMPDRRHYFYAKGEYEVAVPAGRYRIEAVRGICHENAVEFTEVGSGITHAVDLTVKPLADLKSKGWYSGNTHTHYHLSIDENPDDRIRIVPPAEDLDVSVLSYLIRNDSPYITNRYPVGRLPQFSTNGTIMDMGEEARNNRTFGDFGYGHVLFLNIPRAIEPVSTGLLSADGKAPDYPTLSMLCAEVKSLGGTTVWCHNGSGIEIPVAAGLGLVNAYNLGDGLAADYERYYRLLNTGLKITASSGTDWWIYDHNRVFVQVEGAFTYDSWIAGLRTGRTFISNGPLLEFTVDGQGPGSTLTNKSHITVRARALSRIPFEKIEIVQDGVVVADQPAIAGREVRLERELDVDAGGWIAARVSGGAKTYAGYPAFAHTSPVYLRVDHTPFRRAEAIGAVMDEIERSMRIIRKSFKFTNDAQRALAVGKFEEGRRAFGKLL